MRREQYQVPQVEFVFREDGEFVTRTSAEIFSGKRPSYSDTKLLHRCFREGYLEECCGNCGYDEYRASDMSKPLMLDYMYDDVCNKDLSNLLALCFNCFFIMKGKRLKVDTPKNVKQLRKAVSQLFSSEQTIPI